MNINTDLVKETIGNLFIRSLNKTEQVVLMRLQGSFLNAAKMSAHTFPPDGRTHFQYQEFISSPLVNALSPEIINKLAEADITFETSTGKKGHWIKATFPVIKS